MASQEQKTVAKKPVKTPTTVVDALRTFLMASIFVGHYGIFLTGIHYPGPMYMAGDFAVSGFFGISDTIMVWAYCKEDPFTERRSRVEFILKRAARLLPVYYVTLIIANVFDLGANSGMGDFQSPRVRIFDFLLLNCWVGEVVEQAPAGLMWMIQVFFWISFMFPYAVRFCHNHLKEHSNRLPSSRILLYFLFCYLNPVLVASFFVFSKGWPFEDCPSNCPPFPHLPTDPYTLETWMRPVWRTRENPLSRLAPLLLCVHISLACKRGWRAPGWLKVLSFIGSFASWYFSWIAPTHMATEAWFLTEYIGLPYMATAMPLLVVAERDGELKWLASTSLLKWLQANAGVGLSFYCWQGAIIDSFRKYFLVYEPLRETGIGRHLTVKEAFQTMPLALGFAFMVSSFSLALIEAPLSESARVHLLERVMPPKAKGDLM